MARAGRAPCTSTPRSRRSSATGRRPRRGDLGRRDPGRPRRGLHAQGAEQHAWPPPAGLKIGSTGGVVVDERMATSVPGVFAAGDCIEMPHGLTRRAAAGPDRQPRLRAGQGGRRSTPAVADAPTRPVYVPWGTVAGKWIIGGVSFGETTATALGIPYVIGPREGISRARYYPGVKPVQVKLLAEPGEPAADRRPDGRRRGHQGACRLPRDGRQVRAHAGRPGHDGERLLAGDRCAERAHRRWPPRTASTRAEGR